VAAGPVSRILSAVSGRTVIPLGRALLRGSSDLPGGCGAPSRHASLRNRSFPGNPSLFGLAPCGVCPARRITATAVRSYRTFSPLPGPCGPRRYVFCGTFRPTGLNRPSRTLSGTLLCGVRTFLPPCDERPSGPAANQFIIEQATARTDTARPVARSLTPLVWVRGGTCMSAGPSQSITESILRDRPARRAPAHAEAP
jgi:hypothetical protein